MNLLMKIIEIDDISVSQRLQLEINSWNGSTINGDLIMKLKFRVFCVFVVVLLSAIGCSDDDPRDPDLVIYDGCLFCI